MLMQRMHGNASRDGACRLSERRTESVVAFIGDADPIDCTEHDGLLSTKKHDATAAQREIIHALHWVIGHRGTQRRCSIDIKGGEA